MLGYSDSTATCIISKTINVFGGNNDISVENANVVVTHVETGTKFTLTFEENIETYACFGCEDEIIPEVSFYENTDLIYKEGNHYELSINIDGEEEITGSFVIPNADYDISYKLDSILGYFSDSDDYRFESYSYFVKVSIKLNTPGENGFNNFFVNPYRSDTILIPTNCYFKIDSATNEYIYVCEDTIEYLNEYDKIVSLYELQSLVLEDGLKGLTSFTKSYYAGYGSYTYLNGELDSNSTNNYISQANFITVYNFDYQTGLYYRMIYNNNDAQYNPFIEPALYQGNLVGARGIASGIGVKLHDVK
jgi:hypothetical protein